MRIAYLVDRFPSLSVTFIVNEITALLRRGHDVEIFAAAPGDLDVVHPDVEEHRLLARTTFAGVPRPLLRRGVWGLATVARNLGAPRLLARSLNAALYREHAYTLRLLAGAAALRNRGPYDVVHAHFGPNGELAVLLREIGAVSAAVVTTFHGYGIRLGLERGGGAYRFLRQHGDLFLAISHYNEESMVQLGLPQERIVRHPVGIDLSRFPFRARAVDSAQPLRILSVATLYSVKAHDVGLSALARVRRALPELSLEYHIAGGGPLHQQLEAQIAELGLTDVVTLLGPCTGDRVREELSQAHLFLLPSRAEATPVALMEAQACGLPVIATRVGGVAEVVRDGESGFLVPPEDSGAMAERLGFLVANPQMWEGLGRVGRRHMEENHDHEHLADRLVQLYRGLPGVTDGSVGASS